MGPLELCDSLIRLVNLKFKDSEHSYLSTRKKVWFILDAVCRTIGEKRNCFSLQPEIVDISETEATVEEEPVVPEEEKKEE